MNVKDLQSEQDKLQDLCSYEEADDQFNMGMIDEENEK